MLPFRNRERESFFWLHKQLRFKYACINSAKNRFGLAKDRPLPYYKLLKSQEMVNGDTNLVKGPFARHHHLEFGSSGLEFGRIWEEFGSSWQEFGSLGEEFGRIWQEFGKKMAGCRIQFIGNKNTCPAWYSVN